MISKLKNKDGFVFAYTEWRIVDETGHQNKAGHYCLISDLWIHPNHRQTNALKELIAMIDSHERMNDVIGVYWENLKNGTRLTPMYSRERLARFFRKESECLTYA